MLLTVVLAGDQRLLQHFRSEELLPLDSRMRVRLVLERASPEELRELLAHALAKAGAPKLMTAELIATLCDHAQGNPRALMNMAGELLAAGRPARSAAHRRAAVLRDLRRARGGAAQARGTAAVSADTLPVEPAWRLSARPDEQRWLVTGLWAEQAVGIVGGEPKCCKSFLALDLAVAVASGTPCLRHFAVPQPGRVLLYAAEDALHVVRQRLEGICVAAGCRLADLDVQVITAPTLRLDLPADRAALERTVAELRPRLLILDPFVRLHRIDENASGEVAPLLAYLRELQRRHALSVLVVHHAKKSAGAHPRRPGAARLLRVPRLGRLQPLPAPLGQRLTPHHRTSRRPLAAQHHRSNCKTHGDALALAPRATAPRSEPAHAPAPWTNASPPHSRTPLDR